MQMEGSPHFNESALHLACSHSRDTDPSSGNRLHARVHSLGEQVVQRCKTTHSPVICIVTLPFMHFGSECSVWHMVIAYCVSIAMHFPHPHRPEYIICKPFRTNSYIFPSLARSMLPSRQVSLISNGIVVFECPVCWCPLAMCMRLPSGFGYT